MHHDSKAVQINESRGKGEEDKGIFFPFPKQFLIDFVNYVTYSSPSYPTNYNNSKKLYF